MGSIPISGNAEDLSQYDPCFWMRLKTYNFEFAHDTGSN